MMPRKYGAASVSYTHLDVYKRQVGSDVRDVRMAQFEQNAQLIAQYGKMARQKQFKGLFAVVSDPVDPLCKAAFLASSKNEQGELDYMGLAPEQVKGYGLGEMCIRDRVWERLRI